jgi:hypothetical protein
VEVSLEGKVALVTGAGPNIGSGIALALSRYGARVACNDIDAEAAGASASRIERHGMEAMALVGDVSDEDDVVRYVREVLDRWGRIDILINNAALLGGRGVLDESLEFWNRAVSVAGAGTFLNTKHVAISMIEREVRGSIVNILSSNAWQGCAGVIAYAFHKGGLANFTRAEPGAAGVAARDRRIAAPAADELGSPELVARDGQHRRAGQHADGTVDADRHRSLRGVDVLGLRAPDHRLRLRHRRRRAGQVLGVHTARGEGGARAADSLV